MLEISANDLHYKLSQKSKCLILKNISNNSPLIFKIKTNNIDVVDAKPNVGYIAQGQSINVIVRALKQQKFNVKLQIISANIPQLDDPKHANIPEQWKKIPKDQTKSKMVNIQKLQVQQAFYTQINQKAFQKKTEDYPSDLMQSIKSSSEIISFGIKKKQSINSQNSNSQKLNEQQKTIKIQPKKQVKIQEKLIKQNQVQKKVEIQKIIQKKDSVEIKKQNQDKKQVKKQPSIMKQLNKQLNTEIKISIKTILIIAVFCYLMGFLNGRFGDSSISSQQISPVSQLVIQEKQPIIVQIKDEIKQIEEDKIGNESSNKVKQQKMQIQTLL